MKIDEVLTSDIPEDFRSPYTSNESPARSYSYGLVDGGTILSLTNGHIV